MVNVMIGKSNIFYGILFNNIYVVAFARTHPNLVFLWNILAAHAGNWTSLDSFSFPLVSLSCRCHARR